MAIRGWNRLSRDVGGRLVKVRSPLAACTAAPASPACAQVFKDLKNLLPIVGSYVAETNFFEPAWQESFWGSNYARLLAVKDKYDSDGLFFVHHGVGSERWSADGFTRLAER